MIYEVVSDGTRYFFANFSDIEKTLRITYSAATALDVVKAPSSGPILFRVTGQLNGAAFRHEYLVFRHPLIDRPDHL